MSGIGNKKKVILALIIIFGFVLRLTGLRWGGNCSVFSPDEPPIVSSILEMVQEGKLVNSNWLYPSMTSSKLITVFLLIVTKVFGAELSPIEYFYVVRAFYAVLSALCIYLSYVIVQRAENENAALLFALLLAVNPAYVRFSKMIIGDGPVMAFWLLVGVFAQRYTNDKSIKSLLLMAFFSACASMEKWNGMAITLLVAFTVITLNWGNYKKIVCHGFAAFLTWIVFMIAIAPNSVFELREIIDSILLANGGTPQFTSATLNGHIITFLECYGIGATILLITGSVYVLFHLTSREQWAYRIPYLVGIINLLVEWLLTFQQVERHTMEIYWLALLLVTLGAMWLIGSDKRKKRFGIILVVLIFLTGLSESILADAVAVRTKSQDTRVVGEKMLESIGSNISNSVGDVYTPYLPTSSYLTREFGLMDWMIKADGAVYIDKETGELCSRYDKQFIVLSSYRNYESNLSRLLDEHGLRITELTSDHTDFDMFTMSSGRGKWYYSELDTIKQTWAEILGVLKGESIGPTIVVYDISECLYKPE